MLSALLLASSLTLVPLNDLGPAPYAYGYFGGLYDDGSNAIPADHLAGGLRRAELVVPRDENGNSSASGKIVFLTIGSGEAQRIGAALSTMMDSDPRVDHQSLVFVNGAWYGDDSANWIPPQSNGNFDRIRSQLLAPAHLSDKQVQAAWIELATNAPARPLPQQDGDAYRLKWSISTTLRALKLRYPNLQIAYLSSRVYGGYATTSWNPEPFAYESALSVRWVILGQITWMRTGSLWDTRIGDLDYDTGVAPWVAWGPYLWANGTLPRSDGLTWQRDDFETDGEQLSPKGAEKGARLLFDFLMHEPTASWFRAEDAALRSRPARH